MNTTIAGLRGDVLLDGRQAVPDESTRRGANPYGFASRTRDMDITVFKLEIDEPTVNAPFSGDKMAAEDEQSDSSGKSIKRVVGLGTLLLAAIFGGAIALKRRLGGDESESDDDRSPPPDVEEDDSRHVVPALVGLIFLIVLSVVMKKRRDSNEHDESP
ncbi:hypothetical protein [Halocatena pleomorpha]|uniref:Uncharacterized protein n=1 Tax=Halocatena pleomorpha TaxID=1785090 RepID=A0A3P3R2U2_9EURY|nr:hypothetical protein [Halocatena pleomorpha]RRJ27685.1 hypothetical protein EIK79_17470 [Halocatena pleomorpha]